MNKKVFLLFCLLGFYSATPHAQTIQKVESLNNNIRQYEKAEWNITINGTIPNPYIADEITLDMLITNSKGITITLPCFYANGDSIKSIWKARFTPTNIDNYSFVFVLKLKNLGSSRSKASSFASTSSNKKGFLRSNNNWSFKYDNGDIFRGIGENICWEARANDDSKFFKALHENARFSYDFMLPKLAANGGNFFRVWMIYWNLPVDWKIIQNSNRYQNSNSRFNESGIKRMDSFIELCDSLNIHCMLALESHASLMGHGWDISSYNVKQGGAAKTPYEFFALEAAKKQYKDKLRYMVARWGYSPTVGVWEFFNEVDNAMFNLPKEQQLPHSIVTEWHREMSDYLKSIDPYKHLVSTSISHRDIDGLNDLPSIDFNQKHIYKNTKIIPQTVKDYSSKYKKPYVIGEFGYEWDWNINFNEISEGMDNDFKRGLWYGLFSPTPILPMSWWWEFFDERGLTPYFKGVRTINDLMNASGNGSFEEIQVNAGELEAYGLKCGSKTFVYLFNSTTSEIKQNIELKSFSISALSIRAFSPELLSFKKLDEKIKPNSNIVANGVTLKAKEEMILIFE